MTCSWSKASRTTRQGNLVMIRRAFLVAAAATALVLAPSVAMAYNAPGYTCFVTDSTPASGHPIKVHCSHGHSKTETLTITSAKASTRSGGMDIAGTKAMTSTNVAGAVTFNVTLAEAGSYGFVLTTAEGALRSSMTVVVHNADAAAPAAAGAAAPAATGGLSRSGFDGMPIAIGGGVLVLLGAGTVLVARRRKSAQVHA